MRTLAKYLRNYKKESILAPFFKFLEVVFDLLVPIVIAQIIDVGIAHNDHGYIVQKFFILILMAAAGLAVSITAQFFAAKASVGFATEVRQAVFDHIQKLSYTELDTLGTDTLITRLTDDVNQVQNGVNMGLRLLLRSPFIVFGAMVMAFTINVRCALIFVVAIPILFLFVFVIMFLSIPLFKKVQGRLDTVTRLTRENLTGVRVIRAFCREDHAVAEFDESNLALTKLNEFVGKISALLNPATYVLINIATVILIQTAGVQVNLGNMQQGEVVALYNYMAQMIVELIKLASLIITLNKSMACADRVAGILKVDSTMAYPEKTSAPAAAKNDCAVAFDHVTFSYAGTGAPSLSDITFSAKKGSTIGIIGGTGSGKSTTLAAIIDKINNNRDAHVITLEDPIEYLHQHKMSMVNQREIGIDSNNYANALRAALREDPDVILVGEMRDFETISVAITAAETGHLVLSTLHTIGAASTVDRVIDVFPPHQQQQIRVQLSNTLEAVISQQLIPTADGKHRVAAFEVMHANHAVRNLIREGKSHQLASVMQTNRKLGMITMDEAIVQLYFEGKIDREHAIQFAQDPDSMENKI